VVSEHPCPGDTEFQDDVSLQTKRGVKKKGAKKELDRPSGSAWKAPHKPTRLSAHRKNVTSNKSKDMASGAWLAIWKGKGEVRGFVRQWQKQSEVPIRRDKSSGVVQSSSGPKGGVKKPGIQTEGDRKKPWKTSEAATGEDRKFTS